MGIFWPLDLPAENMISGEKKTVSIWVFPKIGETPPKWMVKTMENPIKIDDLGENPLFSETSIYKFPSPP